ncbi:MAG: STAS/SEC14 domain-containing protein [Bacteroidales bacterium]
MNQGAKFIEFKGKPIYYVDYSNIKTSEEFLAIIKSTNAFREKLKRDGKKDLLMLVNISESFVYGDVLTEIKKAATLTRELIAKEAIVGITGSKKILLKILQSLTKIDYKIFDTEEEAKEWLVS